MKKQMPIASRIIFTIVSITMAAGAHFADYNKTHMFNPSWTPHARFHGGQTLSFSILLALLTIFFAWRSTIDPKRTVLTAACFATVYWVAQDFAIFYPGTQFSDPDLTPVRLLGIPEQLYISTVHLILIAIASWLALRPKAKWFQN